MVEQRYLTEFCKLTENCKVSSDLVGEEKEKIISSDVNIMLRVKRTLRLSLTQSQFRPSGGRLAW